MIRPLTIGLGLGIVAFGCSALAQNAPPSLTEQIATMSFASAPAAPRTVVAMVSPTEPTSGSIPASRPQTGLDAAIARHAQINGVPESLVHRVIRRESGYRPHVVSKGNYGLMQIKPATARGVGYTGSAAGLLDPETNLTYAVRYLAGAYRIAGGNHDRAVRLYASGYYYEAKRQGLVGTGPRAGYRRGADATAPR